jgi:phosphate transport system protein
MQNKYDSQLKNLKGKLYALLYKIENAIELSLKVLSGRDNALAKKVIDGEKEINRLEQNIEADCLGLLLLEHPLAGDFREVSAALKVITDLERIGDQARDICEICLTFGDESYIKKLIHIPEMGAIAANMVKESVHAYIAGDMEVAKSLDHYDDKVDELFGVLVAELTSLIKQDSANTEQAIKFILIAKYFERIADHAVNIGEWAEYAITGKHKES